MKKINWKVRFKNPLFIAQILISVFVPILTYFGLEAKDLTTWKSVIDLVVNALSNPYVVTMIVVSVFNAINDPVTKGLSDSERALNYTEIK
ncbi:phage holin [Vagococcus carniphilus]|uniref:phage holin n=1 Tax=Vagococcus carniphilus TaxID=218144 RepID=UPI00289214C9|nr:phage holin [Vagococcus carniphilus]MDT2813735.1 phage holin [Vagococcus carniphilus]